MGFQRIVAIALAALLVSCAKAPTAPTASDAPATTTQAPAPTTAARPPAAAAESAAMAAPAPPPLPLAAAAPFTPTPLVEEGKPVKWWFAFKFNAKSFAACGGGVQTTSCPFGGTVAQYTRYSRAYVYADSVHPSLQQGAGCIGETQGDPLGATFDAIYNHELHYVVWNDQFYQAPKIPGCSGNSCGAPWGHSKGTLVWNDAGEGLVLQVSTPAWPGAASRDHPRIGDGNTLGCVQDNDILLSQHFFALQLTKHDVVKVLRALQNASVVTDPGNVQIVRNGGPADIQALVSALGVKSASTTFTKETLSSGVVLISKPSRLNVPPWQFVSAVLGGVSLKTATLWQEPKIYTTPAHKKIGCWDEALSRPGRVEIATSGSWEGTDVGLEGGPGANFNHAKFAVSISNGKHLSVFGDMNQSGALAGNCKSAQNSRGGLFFVVDDEALNRSITDLIDGDVARTAPH